MIACGHCGNRSFLPLWSVSFPAQSIPCNRMFEQVLMRLFNFVEQQHAMRMLIDAVGEHSPLLVEADIARRRADQAADRMAFHIIPTCVEADQFHAHDGGELFRELSVLPTPVGPLNK